jgi:hypothetical protein
MGFHSSYFMFNYWAQPPAPLATPPADGTEDLKQTIETHEISFSICAAELYL